MPIPVIQIPDLAQSGQIGVAPSLAAMNAPWQGLQRTAAGIAKVNDAFAQHADQVQSLENTYQESEARQAIAARMADFDSSLDSNTDPSTYLDSLDKVLADTQSLTSGKNYSPIVAQKLALWHSDVAAQARIRTAARAAGMTTKRASLAISNELEAAATYNNETAYTDALTRGIDGGIILPEQRDLMMQQFQQRTTYNNLARAIDEDPITAAEQLEADDLQTRYPHLTPENRERLTRYAEQKKNHHVAETWTEVQKASLEGITLGKDEVLNMMRQGDLTPEQAGSYLRAYHSASATTFDPIVFDKARSMLLAYDPAKDPTGAGRATIATHLATTPLPKEYIKELQSQFDAKLQKPNAPKHRLATEYATRIDTEWKAESFGDWFDMEKDPVEGRISRKIIREKDFDAALSYKTKVQSQFDAWLMSQPDDLDPIEAGKKYSEIKTGVLQGQPPVELPPPTMFPPPSFPDPTDDKTKTSSIGTFGGQPIPAPGMFIRRAATSIFGGNADPQDNGLSANGGSNNATAGVAIPQKMLQAMFPGKDKAWHFKNVKVVVKADNGVNQVLPLIDYGTAEWVVQRERNHKLDLNPKAVAALGGTPIYKNGKLVSHTGFSQVDFSITTDNAHNLPANTAPNELKTAWFKDKKPRHHDQIESGLTALLNAHNLSALES